MSRKPCRAAVRLAVGRSLEGAAPLESSRAARFRPKKRVIHRPTLNGVRRPQAASRHRLGVVEPRPAAVFDKAEAKAGRTRDGPERDGGDAVIGQGRRWGVKRAGDGTRLPGGGRTPESWCEAGSRRPWTSSSRVRAPGPRSVQAMPALVRLPPPGPPKAWAMICGRSRSDHRRDARWPSRNVSKGAISKGGRRRAASR